MGDHGSNGAIAHPAAYVTLAADGRVSRVLSRIRLLAFSTSAAYISTAFAAMRSGTPMIRSHRILIPSETMGSSSVLALGLWMCHVRDRRIRKRY